MNPAQPLIASTPVIYAVLSILLGTALVAAVHCVRSLWRAWRNHRQVIDEARMRRGFREAARLGYLPEDLQ